ESARAISVIEPTYSTDNVPPGFSATRRTEVPAFAVAAPELSGKMMSAFRISIRTGAGVAMMRVGTGAGFGVERDETGGFGVGATIAGVQFRTGSGEPPLAPQVPPDLQCLHREQFVQTLQSAAPTHAAA